MSSTIPGEFNYKYQETVFDCIDRVLKTILITLEFITPPVLLNPEPFSISLKSSRASSIYEIIENPRINTHRKDTIFLSSNLNDVNVTTIQDLTRQTLMRNASNETLHSTPNIIEDSFDSIAQKEIPQPVTNRSTVSDVDDTMNLRGKSFRNTFLRQKRHSASGMHINTQNNFPVASDNMRPMSSITDYNTVSDFSKKKSRPVAFQPSSSNSHASLIPMYGDTDSNKVMSIETFNKTIHDDEDTEVNTIYKPEMPKKYDDPNHGSLDSIEKGDMKSKIAGLR